MTFNVLFDILFDVLILDVLITLKKTFDVLILFKFLMFFFTFDVLIFDVLTLSRSKLDTISIITTVPSFLTFNHYLGANLTSFYQCFFLTTKLDLGNKSTAVSRNELLIVFLTKFYILCSFACFFVLLFGHVFF